MTPCPGASPGQERLTNSARRSGKWRGAVAAFHFCRHPCPWVHSLLGEHRQADHADVARVAMPQVGIGVGHTRKLERGHAAVTGAETIDFQGGTCGHQIAATDYARLLCDFAGDRAQPGPVLAMAGRSSLELRVRRLVRPGRSVSGGLVVCCIVVTLTAAVALAWLGPRPMLVPKAEVFSPQEVELRWSANSFPGQP